MLSIFWKVRDKICVDSLINDCANWLRVRKINEAVVGFSGGIDSAVTAALLGACGLRVHLVIAEAPNQKYSSAMGGFSGAKAFAEALELNAVLHGVRYEFMFSEDAANEAAAPIQRVAGFYGVCAQRRAVGNNAIVVGTANFDEAGYLGFWGKASDAAQDFYPISHLHKSEVRALAKRMSLPKAILDAVPSGDLLFRTTNDFAMIGATYAEVETVAKSAERGASEQELIGLFSTVSEPTQFCKQIVSNGFKYDLPFGGFHLSSRLETFRKMNYPKVLNIAKSMADKP